MIDNGVVNYEIEVDFDTDFDKKEVAALVICKVLEYEK